jgi:hypothetical protein
MRKQQGSKEDIGIDSIAAETNQTHTIIARSYLRLTNLDNQVFERLVRYETTLWRQTAQILQLLSAIFAVTIVFQMSVHVSAGCGESTDGIRPIR